MAFGKTLSPLTVDPLSILQPFLCRERRKLPQNTREDDKILYWGTDRELDLYALSLAVVSAEHGVDWFNCLIRQ